MSIFVIGKNGYVAKRFVSEFNDKYDIQITSSSSTDKALTLDLLRPDDFNYEVIRRDDLILLLAAVSSPDICVNNYDFAYNLNVSGTSYFIEKCVTRGARVLFFSSDTVYGDKNECFNENSICKPVGKYGEMKYAVETKFTGEKNFKVFRLSYVFSKDDKFTSYLYKCSKNSLEAEIFHPFNRSVVYIKDLMDSIAAIHSQWDKWNNQVFNLCGPQLISRLDIARQFKNQVNPDFNFTVTEPSLEFFRARPKEIKLESLYLESLIGRTPLTITEALKLEFPQEGGETI